MTRYICVDRLIAGAFGPLETMRNKSNGKITQGWSGSGAQLGLLPDVFLAIAAAAAAAVVAYAAAMAAAATLAAAASAAAAAATAPAADSDA